MCKAILSIDSIMNVLLLLLPVNVFICMNQKCLCSFISYVPEKTRLLIWSGVPPVICHSGKSLECLSCFKCVNFIDSLLGKVKTPLEKSTMCELMSGRKKGNPPETPQSPCVQRSEGGGQMIPSLFLLCLFCDQLIMPLYAVGITGILAYVWWRLNGV